jgi:hypothetical protein
MRSNVIKIHMLAAALFLPLLFSAYATGIVPASAKTLVPDSGSGARVFTHIATALNSAGDWTDLDNSTTNNNPSAVVYVTPNWNPGGSGGTYDNHPIGVWYHSSKWAIFNQDLTAIPTGASFNVMVLSTGTGQAFVHVATASNSAGNYTDISNRITNSHPDAIVFVTPNWNITGVYNNHPIGVWYHGTQWSIFNQDGAAVSTRAAFNVLAVRVRAV